MRHRVTLIPGDGIGPEVAAATRLVLDAADVGIEWVERSAGSSALETHGDLLPSETLDATGMALGMFEGSTYAAGTARLEPGDALVMYSDGITEAEDPTGQPFDEAGLERTLALYPGTFPDATAASVGQAIFDAVEHHRRDSRLADDLSVLVLSRLRNG